MVAVDMLSLPYRCIRKVLHVSRKRVKEELERTGKLVKQLLQATENKCLFACWILICIHKVAAYGKSGGKHVFAAADSVVLVQRRASVKRN